MLKLFCTLLVGCFFLFALGTTDFGDQGFVSIGDRTTEKLTLAGNNNNTHDMVQTIIQVMIYSAFPVGTEIVCSLAGLLGKPNAKLVSGIQHLSAGVVASAVAVEIMPILLAHFNRKILDFVAVIVGFAVGLVGLNVMAHFLPEHGHGHRGKEHHGHNDSENHEGNPLLSNGGLGLQDHQGTFCYYFTTLPWLMLLPLAIDTFLDGILLALAYVAEPNAGLVMAIAFAFETAVLGVLTTTTLIHKGFPRIVPVVISIWLASLFFIGGILGSIVLSQGTKGELFLGFLSFGVAALLFLVIDDLLIEAREKKSAITWLTKSQFYVGFISVMIFHEVVGH